MKNWVESAEARAIEDFEARLRNNRDTQAAKKAKIAESVTEESVKGFLEPFASAMILVRRDLRAHGYVVTDEGYKYISAPQKFIEEYALTKGVRQGDRSVVTQAFGRLWTIDTRQSGMLDILGLFPLTSESSHFAGAHYDLVNGGDFIAMSPEDTALGLQKLIGSRIISFFSLHPAEVLSLQGKSR